ncbi:MAG: putative membrane protein YfcA [Myxococcota bacterium]|jgi:uncharacterized membrane protein YfcA
MSWMELLLLMCAGCVAGIINTLAGGGSFLTVAALIFAGLPADVANGTNRLGVLLQTGISTDQFRRAGKLEAGTIWRLMPPTCAGALLGSWLSLDVDPELLSRIIGVAMLAMLPVLALRPKRWLEGQIGSGRPGIGAMVGLFFVGIYGGFLQAGVGIFLLASLVLMAGQDLVRANASKALLVFVFTIPALAVFISRGAVDWGAGAAVASGAGVGGWLGTRLALRGGSGLVRVVLAVVLLLSGARLVLS